MRLPPSLLSWIYVTPLLLVIIPFFVMPIIVVIAASVLQGDGFGGILPIFTWENYQGVFTDSLTLKLYLSTLKFTVLTWFFTLVIGFWIAYYLVFHIRSELLAMGLFLAILGWWFAARVGRHLVAA